MYFVDDAVFGSFVPVMAVTNKIEVEPIPLKATSDKVYPSRIWGQCLASIDRIVKYCQLPKVNTYSLELYSDVSNYILADVRVYALVYLHIGELFQVSYYEYV